MAAVIRKTFLQAVRLERDSVASFDRYPFCIPAVRHLKRLEFDPTVTFFIGENGSGKSTLLEAIATKYGFNAEGGSKNFRFSETGISEVKYTETEHYQITKDFLNRHERMLDLLLSAEDEDLESKRRKD